MRYSIGDVSRVLGMTTSALHFYEKEGVINTLKEDSGRRYYTEADICRLISAKKYRAMGVPVREIAQQFGQDGMDGRQVMSRMRERREEAARVIRQQEGMIRDIDRLTALGEEALSATGEVDIRRACDMLVLCSDSGGRIPRDKQAQAVAQRWMEAMPAVSIAICREMGETRAWPTLMISAERAQDFGLETDGRIVRHVPGGMALHAIVICGEEQYDQPDVIFRPILAFAREHRFAQRGTMWGSMLFVDCSGGVRKHYYDTYMCFETGGK